MNKTFLFCGLQSGPSGIKNSCAQEVTGPPCSWPFADAEEVPPLLQVTTVTTGDTHHI